MSKALPSSLTRRACKITLVLFVFACARPALQAGDSETRAAPALPASNDSTINARMQAVADDEIDRVVRERSPDAAAILILDPGNGQVLANAGRARGSAADVAVTRAFIPASPLKAVTIAAALEEGAVALSQKIDCSKRQYGSQELRDPREHGLVGLGELLAVSTNVGISRVFDALGGEPFALFLHRFHFGEAPRIEGLPAAAGTVPDRMEASTYAGAWAAIGHGVTASPLQVAAAYAVFANGGLYSAPTLSRHAVQSERLIRPDTARHLLAMLDAAVNDDRGTGKRARVDGARVAGKTGTGEYTDAGGQFHVYASFVGIVPVERPRFVILVGVDRLQGDSASGEHAGPTVAAPVFSRVASRVLAL